MEEVGIGATTGFGPLTIRIGGTTVMYDGSTAQTVTIADGTEVSY